ncbi:PREDICTED: uncharacterized protein LOC104803117 [Tarenaya hassleriana]|uniref:uncharacterized protein LOC104803117 n=1 Tax=Tarenaya hassleriana TaxID=28532 RepID=UPI00053C68B1|nr:PREDICTED: uncharacterized protein LOC104803117 [Tarenaya hassleriana]
MEVELVHLPIHPHPLAPFSISGFSCLMCFSGLQCRASKDYWCTSCSHPFHKECAESPLELNHHPYHPPHPLTLRPLDLDTDEASGVCSCCGDLLGKGWVYHCIICKFIMHFTCAKKPPVLEVDRPKSHDHKLFLLPKPRPFTCEACGLTPDGSSLPWGCHQCGAMLHRECFDLPRLVRISRHQHRLCFAPSPPPPAHDDEAWSCGVCRKVVDNHYGAYSCIKGCHYVVHSRCATREDVWDGKDLEGEPEELEDFLAPFEVIYEKVIHHFSHEHHLKLNEDDDRESSDRGQHCQACALPCRVHFGNTYRCTHDGCDFIFHEKCANLPRNIWHLIHPHRLKLQKCEIGYILCDVCYQISCGFIYTCCKEDCSFKIDVACASVSEPFIHNNHPHPLFSTSMSTNDHACWGCREQSGSRKIMQCIECDFNLCFRCVTLPPKVRYKQDIHHLVLGGGGGEEAAAIDGGRWWCEICEGKMDEEKEMYYTCDICCVTVHVHCILGQDPLMMPGRYLEGSEDAFEIEASISCCRPFCHKCGSRCPFPIHLKKKDLRFCSLICLFS